MNKLLVGSVGLAWIATGSAAVAADLPAKPVHKAPPAPVADLWNGFYAGVNGGVSIARGHTVDTSPFPGLPLAADFHHASFGGIFGVQAGWNWHVVHAWVLGVEADWQWSGQT